MQTIGRAARNSESRVIMYADVMTGSMERAISETNRRRKIQKAYNEANHITPQTIIKSVKNTIEISTKPVGIPAKDIPNEIEKLKALMHIASASLDFEKAIELREKIKELKQSIRK